ncbi:hypothetical protein QN277_011853 [Acacia crassicarpa]|uniref:PGG domain-containing protein n=1 Tax=Acacia crassicarpa TaxID=499986 RepID=A0AAE1TCT4_9FABA|nr:hypothetical protein QN277_011853 [Acacia crassicarpa]KAK4280204.1 hypothetical protein QN277_011853 [Acacia crassicarpa]
MASDLLLTNEDEEISLQCELKADRPELALETSGSESDPEFDDNGSVWLQLELEADGSEPTLETTGFETDNGPGNGESWLLPTLKSNRSKPDGLEPVLEMSSRKEDVTTWRVFYSPTRASFVCVRPPIEVRAGMSNYLEMYYDQKMGQITSNNVPGPIEDRAGIFKLTEQPHVPNKDYNLLKDAYRLMKPTVELPDNAILKQRTPSGNTFLHLAASYGNDVMVDKVVQHAPQLFMVVNDNYDTALHVAAKKGHGTTIKLLLKEFLLFVRRRTNGRRRRHQSLLELVLMVSLTLFRNKQGNTFLHEACRTSSHNGAAIFAAFNAPFIVGQSIQFDEDRYKKVVHDLATFEVNVEGKSLLYLTVEANCAQGVDQLMDSCIERLQPNGKSPLLAALINKNLGMLETILSKKQGWIHLRNEQGWLPLHHAVFLGYLQGVLYLVKQCPSCTMERDNNGSLPIHLACIEGHVKIVQELLTLCLDLADMVNHRGQNLLHIACTYRNYELVRYLLEDPSLGIMINQKDINGNTPLHLATISWNPKIVHALTWDKRVDLSVLNNEKQTTLDIAEIRQGRSISLSQRLTWNALVSAGTPRSSVRFHPKEVETDNTSSDIDKQTHTTEQYKDRIDTLIVVSTLIITTSFAVGFTFPGDAEQGVPILLNHPLFHLFILSLTISAFGAISSTIILMWARLGDLHLAVFALYYAMPLLGLSLTSLSLAFLAGMHLLVSKLSWLATTILVIGVVLILMVEFLYLLLWLPSSSSLPFFRYISYYPFLFFANIAEGKMDANKMGSKAISRVL